MSSRSLPLLFGLIHFYLLTTAQNPLSNGPQFTSSTRTFTGFKTEPTLFTENFEVQRIPKDRSSLSPGYLFMNSMMKTPKYGHGLTIYTEDGELVWRGHQEKLAQNLHVCDYLGSKGDHLCYHTRWTKHRIPNLPEGESLGSPVTTYGRLMILDSTYKKVNMFKSGFDNLSFNGHAFETHDEGYSATTIVARPRAVDLTERGGPKQGWILNQCIQDFDLPSGGDAFHWCYFEAGLSVWESKHIFYMGKATKRDSWDFIHTNAIAKNREGDYVVSLRHADTLVKVAGKRNSRGFSPGDVMWRLGGRSNDFEMLGFNTRQGFTRQHDVQVISTNATTEVVSILNNAFDEYFGPSQQWSDGQIISVNTETMEATRIRDYPHPRKSQGRGRSLSSGRGSMQQLPNGNVLMGWGALPDITEFSENGTVLYHTRYTASMHTSGRQFSYRIYRAPWVGKPHWPPKLVAYTPDCDPKSPLTAYASHNGATEIKNWRFGASNSKKGPWKVLGTFAKDGFETKVKLRRDSIFYPFILAQALDLNGNVLASTKSLVFVPKDEYKPYCRRQSCQRHFVYDGRKSRAKSCYIPTSLWGRLKSLPLSASSYAYLVVLMTFIEGLNWASQLIILDDTWWITTSERSTLLQPP